MLNSPNAAIFSNGSDGEPLVELPSGQLLGTFLPVPGFEKQAVAFLAVPYAAPPVGDLRFEDPQPIQTWEGVKEATEYGEIMLLCMNDTMW